MLAQTLDVTTDFNLNNGVKIDCSLWQNITVQAIGNLSGTINITGTNDSGAIQGVSDGGPLTSTNYVAVQGTNLATGATVTAIAAAGLFKIVVSTRFIQIGGASAATDGKVIIFFNTPA